MTAGPARQGWMKSHFVDSLTFTCNKKLSVWVGNCPYRIQGQEVTIIYFLLFIQFMQNMSPLLPILNRKLILGYSERCHNHYFRLYCFRLQCSIFCLVGLKYGCIPKIIFLGCIELHILFTLCPNKYVQGQYLTC